jgi:hypothetical protein
MFEVVAAVFLKREFEEREPQVPVAANEVEETAKITTAAMIAFM